MKVYTTWNRKYKLTVDEYLAMCFAMSNDDIFVTSKYAKHTNVSGEHLDIIISELVKKGIFKKIGKESYNIIRADNKSKHSK